MKGQGWCTQMRSQKRAEVSEENPHGEKKREKGRKMVSVAFNTLIVDSMLLSRNERLTLCHFEP